MKNRLTKFTIKLIALSLISKVCFAGHFPSKMYLNKKHDEKNEMIHESYYSIGPFTKNEFYKKMGLDKKSNNGTTCTGDLDNYTSYAHAFHTIATEGKIITNGEVDCNFYNNSLLNKNSYLLIYVTQCVYTNLDDQGINAPLCNTDYYQKNVYFGDYFVCSDNGIENSYINNIKLTEGNYLTYTWINITINGYDQSSYHILDCYDSDYITVTK